MKNHKGFTIVELLIGMTILSIVAVALTGFIVSSSKSYAASNTEIIVQQESQLAMNQMSDVIIDTTRSVNYAGYSMDGSVSEQVVKDADFTIDVEDKCLVLYNGEGTVVVDADGNPVLDADGNPEIAKDADGKPIVTGGNGNKNYQIYWDKSEEKLFYSEIDISETDFPESDRVLLAEYVKDFSVDLSQVEEKRVVKLTLSYGYNNKVYETSNNITIRNKVLVNSLNLAVNKSVELNIRVKENMVVLEPGEDYYKFSTPIVDGRNVIDKSVTWSIPDEEQSKLTAGWDTKFTDTDTGMIHISSAEQANSFKVRVTTNAVDSAGNHASAEVIVYVKRAKSISLSKTEDSDPANAPLEISPGCTFTISANAEGNKLGVTCSKCGDDITIDRQVSYAGNPYGDMYVWRLADNDPNDDWDPTNYVELIESKPNSSTWRVKSGLPTDGSYVFVIQACSLLSRVGNSCGRNYDWPVFGAIELKVVKHKEANITAGGSLHWGAATTISWDIPYYHYYVICARIREYGTEGNDKIMIYLSEGTTTLVTPDMFGVDDVSKPWYLSLQVLKPETELPSGVGISDQLQIGAQVNDPAVLDIINDYLKNCDSTGTYVGTKYVHSDKLEATINPPEIYYEYNGEKNLGGELNLKQASLLSGTTSTQFKVDYVKNTRDEVLGYWFANNNIKFSVYKETADGGLQKIYWYNPNGGYGYYEGNASPYDGLLQFGEINASNAIIKWNSNNMGRASEAVGKYQLIPTIMYEQNANADHTGRGDFLYYLNYKPNYNNKQYYEDKRSTVHFELVSGGNITLIAHDGNDLREGDAVFTIPSDTSQGGFTKYFNLKDTSLQHAKEKIKIKLYTSGGSKDIEFADATCEYIASDNVYRIELFYTYYDQTFARNIKVSAGTFKCAADGDKWIRERFGTLDELYRSGTTQPRGIGNARIEIPGGNGKLYDTYIPVPSDSDFGSFLGLDLDAIKAADGFCDSTQYVITVKCKDGNNNTQDIRFGRIKCRYDKSTKTYTLNVTCVKDQNDFDKDGKYTILTLTCPENAREWTSVN